MLLDRLRDDQILAIGGHFGLRAGDVDGSHGPDFHLAFIIRIKFLRYGHGLLLHLYVFSREDQFPIGVGHLVCRVDGLLCKRQVRDLLVDLGDADKPRIHQQAPTVEQLLVEENAQRGLHRGVEDGSG